MTRVICQTMRRQECKLSITSVSPNQWIILLTMHILKRHIMCHTAVTRPTPGTGLLLARSVPVPKVGDYSWPVTPVRHRV